MNPEGSLKDILNKPLFIGGKRVRKRLFLAPMAGLGHMALREVIAGFGGFGLLFTEMCSAKAVPQENRNISNVFKWKDKELKHLVCQLFGPDPETMARAAKRVEKEGFWGVDINFGCSVAGICKKECGAAVLKTPDRAVAIVKAIRKSVSIPVLVKYRTGWENSSKLAIDLAGRFESAGADALVFHPRVAPDRRCRPPKWDYIRQVKEAVTIPVFGNGNVFTQEDCLKMLLETGCDGASLGRIAVAKPWIFSEWTDGEQYDYTVYKKTALSMIGKLSRYYEPALAVKHFKKFSIYYLATFSFGHKLNRDLLKAKSIDDIICYIHKTFSDEHQRTLVPNMNMII